MACCNIGSRWYYIESLKPCKCAIQMYFTKIIDYSAFLSDIKKECKLKQKTSKTFINVMPDIQCQKRFNLMPDIPVGKGNPGSHQVLLYEIMRLIESITTLRKGQGNPILVSMIFNPRRGFFFSHVTSKSVHTKGREHNKTGGGVFILN